MKDINFEQLEKDLTDGNKDAAATTLTGFFESDLTREERGQILLNFAMIYAKVKTKLNADRLEYLQGILSDLKLVDQLEREGKEGADLDEIRKRIQDS